MKQIKQGSTGLSVQYAQLALLRAGEPVGALDGAFGSQTLAAVRGFQQRNGLAADGIVGPDTWAALFPYLTGYTLYPVRAGDTLSAIARRYGTTAEAIRIANPNAEPDALSVGSTLTVPLPFPVATWDVPYSSMLSGLVLDGLRARYPKLTVAGYGASVQGRRLLAASFGAGQAAVGINASHHANEWITTPLTLRMLEAYLYAEAYGCALAGFDARLLYASTRLTLTPLVNPDGVDLVTGYLPANDPAFQRAMGFAGDYPRIPFPSGWKANLNGVDLNLGYPAGWERAREKKFAEGYTRPGPRDYVGQAPLTEPENVALWRLTQEKHFRLTVSYHTQGAEIYWRYDGYAPAGAERIVSAFAAASGYAPADPSAYSGYAGYKDQFIDAFDRPGFTVEAGRGTNPLPIGDLGQLYRENIGIFANSLALATNA
ncbi:MAG: peptidoglycan-binding protein [Clostridia bacterium]|nr:peptidoglycan-binding protein [Clostridia bacterium]